MLAQPADVDARIPHTFGSALTLAGAFAIGWVLHQVFVRQMMSIVAPASVIVSLAGVGLILVGRSLERRFDPSEFVVDVAENEEDEEEFDEEFSPLSESDFEGYERDDTR